jgi:hypothetical protein
MLTVPFDPGFGGVISCAPFVNVVRAAVSHSLLGSEANRIEPKRSEPKRNEPRHGNMFWHAKKCKYV